MNVICIRKDSKNNYLISGSCHGKQINTHVYIGYTKRDAADIKDTITNEYRYSDFS